MPEANIVFTSVASIHPFCREDTSIFFWGNYHSATACPWLDCDQGALPSLGLDNHTLMEIELRQNKDRNCQ